MSNVNLLKIFECNYTYLKVTGGEKIFMKFICYILTLLAVTAPAYGQETNVISEHKDWTVYADGDLCWAATQPDFSLSKYKRGGKILKKTPDRGDEKYIALTIAFKKASRKGPMLLILPGILSLARTLLMRNYTELLFGVVTSKINRSFWLHTIMPGWDGCIPSKKKKQISLIY